MTYYSTFPSGLTPLVEDALHRALPDAKVLSALDGGIDPRAGKRRVELCLTDWLEVRSVTVAKKTSVADRAVRRLSPIWFLNMSVRHIGAAGASSGLST